MLVEIEVRQTLGFIPLVGPHLISFRAPQSLFTVKDKFNTLNRNTLGFKREMEVFLEGMRGGFETKSKEVKRVKITRCPGRPYKPLIY